MKALYVILLVALFSAGCRPAKPSHTLHIEAVQACEDVDVVGTFDGKEYSLSASRDNVPLYVACYDPIKPEDVGRDFHAELNVESGSLLVDVPEKGHIRYNIHGAKEAAK